jgi:hypothetical protein
MNSPDTPFPRTLAALSRLSPRQLEFVQHLQNRKTGIESYRLTYGESRSRCPRKAASKIKSSRAVREYLTALGLERHVRAQVTNEARIAESAILRIGSYRGVPTRQAGDFDKAAFIASRLEAFRAQSMQASQG